MTPLRLFHHDPDTLEYHEIVYHPIHQTFRYLGCLISAVTYWMRTKEKLKDDYLRYGREKPSDIHRRLTLRWGIKEHLKTKLK